MSVSELHAFDCLNTENVSVIDNAGTSPHDNLESRDHIDSDSKSYDANFKKFFSRKEVLAGILMNVIPEYRNYDHETVMNLICESEIDSLNAELFATDDIEGKNKIIYDIIVKSKIVVGEIETHLLFDLEMQRKFNTPYPLLNRAIYYTSRAIAKQQVVHSRYQDLLPVHSTWICLYGIPKDLQNKVIRFRLDSFDKNGNLMEYNRPGKDLIGIDFILLSDNYQYNSDDEILIRFLQSIFHNQLDDKNMNPYVKMSEEVSKEVAAIMTENEQAIYELRAEREEGKEEGREEGIEEGEHRLSSLISTLLEANRISDVKRATSSKEYREKLYKEFNL